MIELKNELDTKNLNERRKIIENGGLKEIC
jgi:hypothetical protein